jgi:hypothetical protein
MIEQEFQMNGFPKDYPLGGHGQVVDKLTSAPPTTRSCLSRYICRDKVKVKGVDRPGGGSQSVFKKNLNPDSRTYCL